MSAATDSTPRTTDGDVAAELLSAGTEDSESLSREWLRLLVATLARTGLILAVSMAAWASVPALWGWEPTTVMSGSMEPSISTGDVVVVRPLDPTEYKQNRVVLVDDPDHADKLRLHRIVESNESGSLVLRGDANNDNDASPVAPAAVHGVGFLNVPYIGLPVYWITTAQWLKVLAVVGGFILMCWASTLDRALQRSRHRADPPSRGSGRDGAAQETSEGGLATIGLAGNKTPTVMRTVPTGRRSVRIGAAVVASALVLGTVPVAAQAAFTATSSNSANTFAGAPSCGATMLADGPTSLYQFDADTGTTVADSAVPGTGNATFNGTRAATLPKSGPCPGDGGKSASFDGSTSNITISAQSIRAPETFSYETWVRTPINYALGGKIISYVTSTPVSDSTADSRVLHMLNSGQVRFGLTPGASTRDFLTAAPAKRINDGQWHHVAVTVDDGFMRLYVDGYQTNAAGAIAAVTYPHGSWTIGTGPSRSWTADRTKAFFAGDLDNVAIYGGKTLSAEQVLAHFNAGRAAMLRP